MNLEPALGASSPRSSASTTTCLFQTRVESHRRRGDALHGRASGGNASASRNGHCAPLRRFAFRRARAAVWMNQLQQNARCDWCRSRLRWWDVLHETVAVDRRREGQENTFTAEQGVPTSAWECAAAQTNVGAGCAQHLFVEGLRGKGRLHARCRVRYDHGRCTAVTVSIGVLERALFPAAPWIASAPL